MSTLEMQQEMFDFIRNEDEATVKGFYKLMKSYLEQRRLDKMIEEGEKDIKEGKVYTQSEVQKMIESWVK